MYKFNVDIEVLTGRIKKSVKQKSRRKQSKSLEPPQKKSRNDLSLECTSLLSTNKKNSENKELLILESGMEIRVNIKNPDL